MAILGVELGLPKSSQITGLSASYSSSLALGVHPALLSLGPRGEEIRVSLSARLCSVTLLSSVCGRSEVLLTLASWGQGVGMVCTGGHPMVSVSRIFISSVAIVDFHSLFGEECSRTFQKMTSLDNIISGPNNS